MLRLLLLAGAVGFFPAAPVAFAGEPPEPNGARRGELVRLVRQDCGSCHGMTLKGGLGLPLTAEALRDKPAESLAATIVYGRPGTAMPPWSRFLSETEADWIVGRLMAGFPDEGQR
ncbi:MAG: cytochrome c [Rhodocyclaceae bacterium]|nr:cytochrome c [Rhodocyclaceae bacterium]